MKLDLSRLMERARRISKVEVSGRMEVLAIDDQVDAETGERTEVRADGLRGMSVWEAARALHDRYAGDTVFVVRTASAFAVVRPPFSELPVHYWRRGDSLHIWSGLESPAEVIERPPAFDLDYLAGTLLNPSWQTAATGFRGISELLSGAVLLCDGNHVRQVGLLADAVLELDTSPLEDYSEQVTKFRRLILNSVRHKTRQCPREFSIKCSGGLDSAVITLAAAELYPNRRMPLLNSYSEADTHGDERYFFKALARCVRGRQTFVETNARSSRTGLSTELLAATTRPCKMSGTVATTAQLHEAAQANGSRVVLSGDGGDQLFLRNWRTLFSREIVGEAASLPAALKAVSGLAIQDRCSFWQVAREVITGSKASKYGQHFFGEMRFPRSPISDLAMHKTTELTPHASRLSVLGISRAFQYFGMRNAELNRVRFKDCFVDERKPFVFWPLVRAALAARRGHHLAEGKDRALERDAFKKEIPRVIYDRAGKGSGRDVLVRFDYDALAAGLLESPVCRYGLVSRERIKDITRHKLDYDTAFALVRARAIADWMNLYEVKSVSRAAPRGSPTRRQTDRRA